MEHKIRLGLIGLGKMGISHLAIAGGNENIEVVGVCDTSKLVAGFIEKQTPFKVYDDFRLMVKESKPDAVIVSVPTKYHAEIIEELLDSHIHVFSEKPLTLDTAISQRLAEKAEQLGLVNQVGYHNHFIGTFEEMCRLIDKKVMGDLYHFTAEAYGPVVTKEKDSTWRSKPEEGGGCLYDYASHVIDLVNYALGEIKQVSAGLSGILSVNWSDEAYRKMSTKITVQGKNGKLIVDATELKLYLNGAVKGETYERGWNTVSIGMLQDQVDFYLRGEEYTAQLDYFVDCIKKKKTGEHNRFRDAAKTDHAIAMIRKSK